MSPPALCSTERAGSFCSPFQESCSQVRPWVLCSITLNDDERRWVTIWDKDCCRCNDCAYLTAPPALRPEMTLSRMLLTCSHHNQQICFLHIMFHQSMIFRRQCLPKEDNVWLHVSPTGLTNRRTFLLDDDMLAFLAIKRTRAFGACRGAEMSMAFDHFIFGYSC